MKDHVKLFSCCIPVKGYLRSILYDLQRKTYLFIPNSIFNLLTIHSCKTFDQVLQVVEKDDREQMEKYFTYLSENEFTFFCSKEDLENFPLLDVSWESSSEIDSIIIDIDKSNANQFSRIANDISKLRPKVIQLRLFSAKTQNEFANIINIFSSMDTKNLELIFPFKKDFSLERCKEIIERHSKITSITITTSLLEEIIQYKQATIRYTMNKVIDEANCGIIDNGYFVCNLNTFCESQNFNTCLNKKLSIDRNGIIRNCPSCHESFGNISNTTISEALYHPKFKNLWNITKDQIDVCKDCEFRHMCTDCRAYIKDINNIYSQPAKCSYNPYIGRWEGEEGYAPVEKCGTYSREKGFMVDEIKIETLNMEIWGG